MTDLERVELALRRVYDHMRVQPWEPSVEGAFRMLAQELAEEVAKAREGK